MSNSFTSFSEEVLIYISEHESSDPLKLLLKKSPFEEVDMKTLVSQIIGRKVAKNKYPFLLEYVQYRYPPKASLEQSSSILTAEYKAGIIGETKSLIDLTGGMGIDTYLLSRNTKQTTYVELSEDLCQLARYNFKILDADIDVKHTSAEDFLSENTEHLDWIYIDPSRRIGGNKKTGIANLQPNIIELQVQMTNQADNVLVKLSPMQDITEIIRSIDFVKNIYTVAVDDEVKELLVHIVNGYQGEADITATSLSSKKESWQVVASISETVSKSIAGPIGKYIYQPHPAIIKSGLQDHAAEKLGLQKLHANSQLYSADSYNDDWKGRVFKIIEELSLQKKIVSRAIPTKQANIISKNHPLSPAQIAKKIGFTEGGEDYLIATTNYKEKKILLHCKRVS